MAEGATAAVVSTAAAFQEEEVIFQVGGCTARGPPAVPSPGILSPAEAYTRRCDAALIQGSAVDTTGGVPPIRPRSITDRSAEAARPVLILVQAPESVALEQAGRARITPLPMASGIPFPEAITPPKPAGRLTNPLMPVILYNRHILQNRHEAAVQVR